MNRQSPFGRVFRSAVVLCCLWFAACTPLDGRDARLAASSLGCMRETLAQKVPAGLEEDLAHCTAAGLIARYCSRGEAWLASAGKELRDLFGRGDAQWRDLGADRRGLNCAAKSTSDAQVLACCRDSAGSRN